MKKLTEDDQKDLADFEALCKRIDTLDLKASEFLGSLVAAWDPETFETNGLIRTPFTPDADLSKCFQWSKTTQGHRYWRDIRDDLEMGKV